MASDYREHLDAASLQLLAETTGFAKPGDERPAFHNQPADIRIALGSPAAARLLDLTGGEPLQHRLLQLAVAVHQTSEDICQAGWIATDESAIDLSLVTFSGQSQHQQFLVGLLVSHLRSPAPIDFPELQSSEEVCGIDGLNRLVELCASANDTERAGALRLLGDRALFVAGMFPAVAHLSRVDETLIDSLLPVLPRAVAALLEELKPQINTLLDVYLTFGPVWYRMAAQNLLFGGEREPLSGIASDFVTARRFLVQVSQGPLALIKDDLYPDISS